MKHIVLFIVLLANQLLCAQIIALDSNQTLEIKKIDINNGMRTKTSKASKKQQNKIINIKFLIKSNDKDSIDVNAFSLIDTENKLRFRLSEYQAHKGKSVVGFGHDFDPYLKTNLLDKKGKPYTLLPKFNPLKKDSFDSFFFEGYENCETKINFGTNKRHSGNELFEKSKNLISVIYYPYSNPQWTEFVCYLSFPYLNALKPPKLELYYGNTKIADIEDE